MVDLEGVVDRAVVLVLSILYFFVALWFGWSIAVCKCDALGGGRQIPILCFTALVVGSVNNLWLFNIGTDYSSQSDMNMKEILNTLFDICFLTLGIFVMSEPWESFYKNGARVWFAGSVVLLKAIFGICYLNPDEEKKSMVHFFSVIVEFFVLVGIMIMLTRGRRRAGLTTATTTTSGPLTAPQPSSYDMAGYKTYTNLLGFHLLTRVLMVVIAVMFFFDSSSVDEAEPVALLFIVAIRASPFLVLAGVAYHWSSEATGAGFERVDHSSAGIQLI